MLNLTEMAGKAVGAARAASAALHGYKGIFRSLKREHGQLQVMLLGLLVESDLDDRRRLYAAARAELLAHARAEEEHFYAVLAAIPETRVLVAHHEMAHDRMDELLCLIDALDEDDPSWKACLRELQDVVRGHIEEEEEVLFPAARRLLSEGEVEALDRHYRVTRERFLLLQAEEARQRHVS